MGERQKHFPLHDLSVRSISVLRGIANESTPHTLESMEKKQPEGIGLALGLAFGVALGVAIGVANDNLSLWLALGISLGLVFGLSYDEQQKRKRRLSEVKVVDGASYTILRRPNPAPGLRHHCWVGDNGSEIELTDEEAASMKLD